MEIAIPYMIDLTMVKDVVENTTGKRPDTKDVGKKIKEFIVEIMLSISEEFLTSNDIELEIAQIIYPEKENNKLEKIEEKKTRN